MNSAVYIVLIRPFFLLVVFCFLSLFSKVNAQADLFIFEDMVVAPQQSILWQKSTVEIRDRVKNNRSAIIKVYSSQHAVEQNLMGQSKPIQLNGQNKTFFLQDLFQSTLTLQDSAIRSVCFLLIDQRTQQHLAKSCVLLRSQLVDQKRSRQKKERKINIQGDVNYAFANNYAGLNAHNERFFNTASINGQLNISDIPIMFNGQYTDIDEPLLQHNLNQFSTYFDPQQIRAALEKKAKRILDATMDDQLENFPALKSMQSKYQSIQNILSNPTAIKEIEQLDQLKQSVAEFDVSDMQSLLQQSDQIQAQLDKVSKLKEKLFQKATEQTQVARDSIQHVIDSLSQLKKQISQEVTEFQDVESLLRKQKGYEQILSMKDSCEQYLAKTNAIVAAVESQKEEILRDPAKVRALLIDHGQINSKEHFLSHISTARVGIIHPNFSTLSMQNLRQKGAHFGYDNSVFAVEAFWSKAQEQSVSYRRDSIETNPFSIVGGMMSILHGKSSKTGLFLAHANREFKIISGHPHTHTGLINQISFGENKRLETEAVFSASNSLKLAEGQNMLENNLQQLALKTHYQEKQKKYNWQSSIEYIGPYFKDFYNPYLRTNSINTTLNANWMATSELSLGFNSFADLGQIWKTENKTISLVSAGGVLSYHRPGFPAIIYTNQFTKSITTDVVFDASFHMLSSSATYSVAENTWGTSVNAVYNHQTGTIDTSNYSSLSLQVFQTVPINATFQLELSGQLNQVSALTEENIEEHFTTLKILFAKNKFRCHGALKYISEFGRSRLGTEWGLQASLLKNMQIQLTWDSARRQPLFRNENQERFQSYFQSRIKYKF